MKSKIVFLAAALLLVGCAEPNEEMAPQAIPVRTVTVAAQTVPNIIELPGRVEPVRVAEVRARGTGIVQERLYEEGTDIRNGQPLFRIDPRELRASLNQTRAALARARATAANARAVVERYRPLIEENAMFNARQELLATERALLQNCATLFVALGGGIGDEKLLWQGT